MLLHIPYYLLRRLHHVSYLSFSPHTVLSSPLPLFFPLPGLTSSRPSISCKASCMTTTTQRIRQTRWRSRPPSRRRSPSTGRRQGMATSSVCAALHSCRLSIQVPPSPPPPATLRQSLPLFSVPSSCLGNSRSFFIASCRFPRRVGLGAHYSGRRCLRVRNVFHCARQSGCCAHIVFP